MNGKNFYFSRGPTNWGYILILILITLLVGFGILIYGKYVFEEMNSLSRFPEIGE